MSKLISGMTCLIGIMVLSFITFLLSQDIDLGKRIHSLIEQLGSEKVEERDLASKELLKTGPSALKILEASKQNKDAEISYQVDKIISAIKTKQEIPSAVLVRILEKLPDLDEKLLTGQYILVLKELYSDWAGIPKVLGHHQNYLIPIIKQIQILNLSSKDKIDLIAILRSKVEWFQETFPGFVGFLDDQDPIVRAEAVSFLKYFRPQTNSIEPQIIKLLEDKNVNVRTEAVGAVRFLGIKTAIPQLIKLLDDDKEVSVRREVIMALRDLKVKEAIPQIQKLLEDKDNHIPRLAVIALGKLEAKESIPEIIKLLKHNISDIRYYAVEALGELGAKESIGEITKLLGDNDPKVREYVVKALIKLEAKESAPEISRLLQDDKAWTRAYAAEALGDFGYTKAIPEILQLLKDKDNDMVRSAAETALVQLNATETIPELKKLLLDSDEGIRRSAEIVLDSLGVPETEINNPVFLILNTEKSRRNCLN
ncbi:MAG: HEAT repeat domain-containing protein, partial [Planctomycetota bacterium]|nr:HEAT repeat domain-containing protein [Planctomycetota bacterium]